MKKLAMMAMLWGAMALQACSHVVEKRVDDKLAKATNVNAQSDLQEVATEAIDNMAGLSDVQRTKLKALRDSTHSQMSNMDENSLKLRALLIEDVVSPKYDPVEVSTVKARLKTLENKRLALVFNTIDEANKIMGHKPEPNVRQRVLTNIVRP